MLSQLCLLGPAGWFGFTVASTGAVILGLHRARSGGLPLLPVPVRLAAALTFAMFSLPIVASGSATFGGYTTLGDTAIQMLGADALGGGRGIGTQSVPSSSDAALRGYFAGSGYPSGALTALGGTGRWVGQDVAWALQPFLAFAAAMLAVALLALATELRVRGRWQVGIATIAAQPSLLFAYYLQGSVKELLAAALVPLLAVLVGEQVRTSDADWRVSDVAPVSVVIASLAVVVGLAAAVWVGPAIALLLILAWNAIRSDWGRSLRMGVLGCSLVGLGSAAVIASAKRYLDVAGTVTTTQSELGNLVTPLRKISAVGVWLDGDFRFQPEGIAWVATQAILAGVIASAGLGLVYLVRRRAWGSGIFAVISGIALVVISSRGSPWADAKAYAIVGPAVLYLALAGLGCLRSGGTASSAVALVVGGVIASGVVASNALAYREASLAPRERLEELGAIARGIDGPVLFTEFEEFAKYFLRDANPEVVADTWKGQTPVFAVGRQVPPFGSQVPVETLDRGFLARFPAILLRRGAYSASPAPGYRRVRTGRWYELWVRSFSLSRRAEALAAAPGEGGVSCEVVRGAIERAGPEAEIHVAIDGATARGALEAVPSGWKATAVPGRFELRGAGIGRGTVRVPTEGRYSIWIEASLGTAADVRVNGRSAGRVGPGLNEQGGIEYVGTARLPEGTSSWSIAVRGGGLRPGVAGSAKWIERIHLRRVEGGPRLEVLPRSSWRSLCKVSVRWVEIVYPRRAT